MRATDHCTLGTCRAHTETTLSLIYFNVFTFSPSIIIFDLHLFLSLHNVGGSLLILRNGAAIFSLDVEPTDGVVTLSIDYIHSESEK